MNYYRSTFFDAFNPMTEQEIAGKLAAAPAPEAFSPGSGALDGKSLRIVLDGGGTLAYAFSCGGLTLSEDGAAEISAPYGAKQLDSTVLFTHLIPGTLRGYGVVVDLADNLATAFELWFGGYKEEPREVWRDFRFGYVDTGSGDPGKRHARTNRLFGKGLYWKDDNKEENLYFFPSTIYSSWVELSKPRGGITLTAPSDYIKIGDYRYIFSRGEQTFGGGLILEIIDLFTVKHVGMRLGFCKGDGLQYFLYEGCGEITGSTTNLALLEDQGTEIHYEKTRQQERGIDIVKGVRPFYRPLTLHPDWTKAEVDEIVRTNRQIYPTDAESSMKSQNAMPLSDMLVGKRFTLRYDDHASVWEYDVTGLETLKYRVDGEPEWHEEQYQCFELAKDVAFFSHICDGTDPLRCPTHAVDFSVGLSTCIDAQLGCERKPWEVGNKVVFGVLEIEDGPEPPAVRRHSLTRDLLGKSFSWFWGPHMKSIHIYSSPESYSWTVSIGMQGGDTEDGINQHGWMWSSPCHYIKIREDAYIMCWVEENHAGIQAMIGINPFVMQQTGFHFGVAQMEGEEPKFMIHAMGGIARPLHGFDLEKFYNKKIML